MRELSLFTGVGGGLLGTHLLGWQPIGYVEWNDYCQRVIRQRILDGILPNAPIFGDIRTFVSSGCAELYRGVADVISAGFPCQPFSIAGKGLGKDDSRNMWPATIATIRCVRPRFCLLENVPNLLAHEYFGTILGELSEAGYDAEWDVFSACEHGAPHTRERLFIFAYSKASDADGGGSAETGRKALAKERRRSGHSVEKRITDVIKFLYGVNPSPRLYEWMMGFPPSWTGLEPVAMGRFHSWLEKHGIR